eukprot:6850154-Ditylum_brightwellii.AAC.1
MARTIDCNPLLNLFDNHNIIKRVDISKTAYKVKAVADNLDKDKDRNVNYARLICLQSTYLDYRPNHHFVGNIDTD